MKKQIQIIILLSLPLFIKAQVGIYTNDTTNNQQPTEDLHVNGTLRISDLPLNGTENSIHTNANGEGFVDKDQTFTASKTLVADENGVLGTVDILPVNIDQQVNSIEYGFNSVPITSTTQNDSEVSVGNLSVRFNGTNPRGRAETISIKIRNDIKDYDGNPSDVDEVIVNNFRIRDTSEDDVGKDIINATKGNWYEITSQKLDLEDYDFMQSNISLTRTKEIYRLSVSVNRTFDSTIDSEATVTLFLEKLTN